MSVSAKRREQILSSVQKGKVPSVADFSVRPISQTAGKLIGAALIIDTLTFLGSLLQQHSSNPLPSMIGCGIGLAIARTAIFGSADILDQRRWERYWHGDLLGYWLSFLPLLITVAANAEQENITASLVGAYVVASVVALLFGFVNVRIRDQRDKAEIAECLEEWRRSSQGSAPAAPAKAAAAGIVTIQASEKAPASPPSLPLSPAWQTASLVIHTDSDSAMTVNADMFFMKAGEQKVVPVAVGENIVSAVSTADASVASKPQVIHVGAGEQKAVLIRLAGLMPPSKPPAPVKTQGEGLTFARLVGVEEHSILWDRALIFFVALSAPLWFQPMLSVVLSWFGLVPPQSVLRTYYYHYIPFSRAPQIVFPAFPKAAFYVLENLILVALSVLSFRKFKNLLIAIPVLATLWSGNVLWLRLIHDSFFGGYLAEIWRAVTLTALSILALTALSILFSRPLAKALVAILALIVAWSALLFFFPWAHRFIIADAVWVVFVFGGIILALRWTNRIWPALFAGYTLGTYLVYIGLQGISYAWFKPAPFIVVQGLAFSSIVFIALRPTLRIAKQN